MQVALGEASLFDTIRKICSTNNYGRARGLSSIFVWANIVRSNNVVSRSDLVTIMIQVEPANLHSSGNIILRPFFICVRRSEHRLLGFTLHIEQHFIHLSHRIGPRGFWLFACLAVSQGRSHRSRLSPFLINAVVTGALFNCGTFHILNSPKRRWSGPQTTSRTGAAFHTR